MPDPRIRLGIEGERHAAEHLERLGFTIVARRHRTRFGELDIVACDGTALVFCEVKTRRSPGRCWESLGPAKRRQVRRMAAAYLAAVPDRPRCREIRFDAIGVVIDPRGQLATLEHLIAAF